MNVRRASHAGWIGLAICCGALIGCGSSTTSQLAPVPSPTATNAPPSPTDQRFRFVNGSPGTGNVDIYIYAQGSLRPQNPDYAGVPFGAITPYETKATGSYTIDILHAGAVVTSAAIASSSNFVTSRSVDGTVIGSIVLSGTNINGTRAIEYFGEPAETAGRGALIVHHASPDAYLIAKQGPIGIGVYSATSYPAGTAVTGVNLRSTKQLFSLSYYSTIPAVPAANTAAVNILFLQPFPVAPFPSAIGFAIGLPSATANGPLATLLANAALSETASENSPFAGQTALNSDATETFKPGMHVSEFLIDSDQNGNVGLIGTVDP